ncbi:MAG TPA: HAD-IC family P-type ATPase, partial [Nevskiaceae bacterium]|nr:HAD-IC family P-type ATPase [Nevskiaceae bacterium]
MADGGPRRVTAPGAGPAGTRDVLIALEGLHCAACVERVKGVLWDRVDRFDVDLATRTVLVAIPHDRAVLARLLSDLKRNGFQPRLLEDDGAPFAATRSRRRELARIGVAAIAAMQVMMLAWPTYFGSVPDGGVDQLLRWGQLLIAAPSLAWCAWPFMVGAARTLRSRRLSMDVPVAASVLIAFAASAFRTLTGEGVLYFDAATMFVSFLLIGRHLESATRAMASERLRRLASDAAPVAQRRAEAIWETVPVSSLSAGDHVRVMPGEVVPVDGTLETLAELDESLLTGESRPVVRRWGDAALAGSLNVSRAPIEVHATRTGADTWRSGIARLLVRAQAERPRTQQVADRVAAHFTFVVLLLAGAGGAWAARQGVDAGLGVVLAVLVASCPCALSLSVPAALASATARLATRG